MLGFFTMEFSDEEFLALKEKAQQTYKEFPTVHCPYFDEPVLFNKYGLEHLKFKKPRKARSKKDQFMRLKLLHLAPIIIRNSKTLQGIKESKSFERVRVHNRTDIIMKDVTYYEFIAIEQGKRVKIIVKQVEDGPKYFWSIIPYWDIAADGRLMFNGKPAED